MAKGESWARVPGAVSVAMQEVHALEGEPTKKPYLIAILDFNVPNARDSLKLKEITQTVATLFKNHDPDRCVVLAHMAAFSKEDSVSDPIDDEHEIYKAFDRVGFKTQQRVRCLLSNPTLNSEIRLKMGDWFVDSRLMYLAVNDMAALVFNHGSQCF